MTLHRFATLAFIAFIAFIALAAPALADPPSPPPPRAVEPPRQIYHFEFSVRRPDDAPNARPATYAIDLEEMRPGTIQIGTNVPLVVPGSGAVGPAPRQDIGLALHFSFELRGNVVVLTGRTEMSTLDAGATVPSAIHRMHAEGVVPVTPGRAAVFTTVTDLTSRRTYEITVTATRAL